MLPEEFQFNPACPTVYIVTGDPATGKSTLIRRAVEGQDIPNVVFFPNHTFIPERNYDDKDDGTHIFHSPEEDHELLEQILKPNSGTVLLPDSKDRVIFRYEVPRRNYPNFYDDGFIYLLEENDVVLSLRPFECALKFRDVLYDLREENGLKYGVHLIALSAWNCTKEDRLISSGVDKEAAERRLGIPLGSGEVRTDISGYFGSDTIISTDYSPEGVSATFNNIILRRRQEIYLFNKYRREAEIDS